LVLPSTASFARTEAKEAQTPADNAKKLAEATEADDEDEATEAIC